MANLTPQTFNSKIILFGEYGIMHNSMGLCIPFDQYKGSLRKVDVPIGDKVFKQSNDWLRTYSLYLSGLIHEGKAAFGFDLQQLKTDIKNGLIFDSTIPQGFGIGSSGALCAALYDRYATNKIDAVDSLSERQMFKLKNIFAQMESFFHGTSSGIDPLICYVNHPMLINNKKCDKVGVPAIAKGGEGAVFLINTGKAHDTSIPVAHFLEKCRQSSFLRAVKEKLIPSNDGCIRAFLKNETKEFFYCLKELSEFFLSHLSPLIPHKFIELWEKGIETGLYYLKLCGAGDGGFLLGFTRQPDRTSEVLRDYDFRIVQRF